MPSLPVCALSLGAAVLLQPVCPAQAPRSIVTVSVSVKGNNPPLGEMYWVDHETNKATRIAVPSLFNADRPICILMQGPSLGFVGTDPVFGNTSGNLYSFTFTPTGAVTLLNGGRPLNTTATAGRNISQLAIVGSDIYFVSQTVATGGTLQKIPMTGGPVTRVYDIAPLTANDANALAAVVTASSRKVYIGTWGNGELIEVDVTGTVTARTLITLPSSRYKGPFGSSIHPFFCVNAHAMANGHIAVLGEHGDKVVVDPATAKVVSHTYHGPRRVPVYDANLIDSGYFDPTTDDWVIGTLFGTVDRWVEGQYVPNIVTRIGSHPAAWGNDVTGVYHFPDPRNSDVASGPGCVIPANGLAPTDVAMGAAVRGNANFKLALYNAPVGKPFFLGIGVPLASPLNFGSPGCLLHIQPFLVVGGTSPPTGPIELPAPLPNAPGLASRQWVTDDGQGGIFLSNARLTTIR